MKNQENDFSKLPDGFLKQMAETKNVIQEIEMAEYQERFDTVEAIQNRIVTDKKTTELQKKRFINEIKTNLGGDLKRNPGEVIIIKRPWYHKISRMFKKLLKTI